MGLIPSSFHGRLIKNDKEVALLIATLYYLRQEGALKIVKNSEVDKNNEFVVVCYDQNDDLWCVCCDKEALFEIPDECLTKLVLDSLKSFQEEAQEPQYVLSFVDALIEQKFEPGELLSLLDRYIDEMISFRRGEFSQPHEISLLLSHLIEKDVHTVFDPFGGFMDFATTMPDKHFVSYETSEFVRNIAVFRLALAGIISQTRLSNESAENWTKEKYDAIVTMPPFRAQLTMRDEWFLTQDYSNAEEVVLSRFENTTNENGQLVMVVPLSALNQYTTRRYRENLTKNNWLDKVILLPRDIYTYTRVSTAIIVLKKNRQKDAPIRFVDASSCVKESDRRNHCGQLDLSAVLNYLSEPEDGSRSLDVCRSEILSHDASWLVGWYLYLRNESGSYREGAVPVPFSDVLERARGTRFDETTGRVITVSDLSKADISNYNCLLDEISMSNNLEHTKKLTEPVLLISSNNVSFPVFCKASQEMPIYVKPNVSAYIIKDATVNIGYLCVELYDRLNFLNKYVSFNSLNRLYEKINISIPSLSEQKNLFEEAKNIAVEGIVKAHGLQNIIRELVADNKKQFRARKHSLMQNSVSLAADWQDLKEYLLGNDGKFDVDDTIGILNPLKISEIIDSISENIEIMEKKINKLTDEDIDWGQAEEIDLRDFINKYIKGHQTTRYRFEFEPERNEILKTKVLMNSEESKVAVVLISKKALLQVFDNIVSNARDHGFVFDDNRIVDYAVKFDITYNFDCIVLEISNNGKALSDGVDSDYIKTNGSSTKLNVMGENIKAAHSGFGGYETDTILKKYNATMEVISNPDAMYTVTYRIVFKDTNVSGDVSDY